MTYSIIASLTPYTMSFVVKVEADVPLPAQKVWDALKAQGMNLTSERPS